MDIKELARKSGLDGILVSLKDGDDVWIDCDVLGGLERFANSVREETLADALLAMGEQDRINLKTVFDGVMMMGCAPDSTWREP